MGTREQGLTVGIVQCILGHSSSIEIGSTDRVRVKGWPAVERQHCTRLGIERYDRPPAIAQRVRGGPLQFAIKGECHVGAYVAVAEEVEERLEPLGSAVPSELVVVAAFDACRTKLEREVAGHM